MGFSFGLTKTCFYIHVKRAHVHGQIVLYLSSQLILVQKNGSGIV